MLSASPDALVAVNTDGEIIFANTQAEHLFGWTTEELLGEKVEFLVPDEAVDDHIAHRYDYLAHPRARLMGEGMQLFARRKGGETFPAEISLNEVINDLGSRVVLAAVRDVSARIKLETELQRQALLAQYERSDRLESLGQLAGGIAHDFNNVLGVILNYATLLSRKITDPVDAADLQEICLAAERASGLTRQLLSFASRNVANPEPFDVNVVVRETALMLDRTLGEDIDVHLDVDSAPLVAMADRQQIEQILLNLAINARDAMPDGGRLTITTAPHGPCSEEDGERSCPDIVLRVTDNGVGMTPEVIRRAFEPFFTTKPRGQGTGLGLASVYGIVRQSGGNVTIDSAVGAGTTVAIVLPGAESIAPVRESEVETSLEGYERILLVEDEPALREGTSRTLIEEGYHVLVAADGIEALEIVDRNLNTIDLVVTDVAMPHMNGITLAKELNSRLPGIPVIFVSGYDSGEPPRTGKLLEKPVTREVLLRAIREVLDD